MLQRLLLLALLVSIPAGGSRAATALWTRLDPPEPRGGHTLTYDPVGQRILQFGGNPSLDDASAGLNDVWAYHLPSDSVWHRLAPVGSPPAPRYGHSTIYDPVRKRLLVFGGLVNGTPQSDLWALDLASWNPVWHELDCCAPPPARHGHAAIYDPAADRMLVFGGGGLQGLRLNDVWSLSLAAGTWTQMAPSGTPPEGRRYFTMDLDAARNRLIVFGGLGSGYLNDVWSLDLGGNTAWAPLIAQGTPPPARLGHVSTIDPGGDRLLVMGGYAGSALNDAWALQLSGTPTWVQLSPAGAPPLARANHSAVLDPTTARWLIHGGGDGMLFGDLWALSLSGAPQWTQLPPTGKFPISRALHSAIFDAPRGRMIVFGGGHLRSGAETLLGDLWSIPVLDPQRAESLVTVGAPPPPQHGHGAIYDPVRDRMIVVGATPGPSMEVWDLALGGVPTWSHWAPGGTPPTSRVFASFVYDEVRDRLLMIGGTSPEYTQVWALSLGGAPAWTLLTCAGPQPPHFYLATAVRDPLSDRFVVYAADQVWALEPSGTPTWVPLAPGAGPASRNAQVAVGRPSESVMLAFSGDLVVGPCANDLWSLSLPGAPSWSPVTFVGGPPPTRSGATAVYDATHDQMLVFGGSQCAFVGTSLSDLWSLSWGGPLAVGTPRPPTSTLAMEPPYPNPARTEVQLRWSLAEPCDVVIRIHDVAGRAVRTLRLSRSSAGPGSATWDGRTDAGAAAHAGLYVFTAIAGSSRQQGRVVLLGR